jgi:hypothetical protein
MTDSRAILVGWLRSEFAEEQRAGFARLKRVPDTKVIRILDHFASLNAAEQAELIMILADWSSWRLMALAIPMATVEEFSRATAFPGRVEGLRYTGVNLLAGLEKARNPGGMAGWFERRGVTGLAMQPPENLLRDLGDLIPAKVPTLRRLVKKTFTQLFAANAKDIGSETWLYEGKLGRSSLKMLIRYSGRMGRPQLTYQVQVQSTDMALTAPNLCFESVLGVGFGGWDYLTQDNAERSVGLLGELVEYMAKLPERLPVPCGVEPGAAPDRGGITVFQSSTSHQPPRQVN